MGDHGLEQRNLWGAGGRVIFTCGPEPEDIFSAVYEACCLSVSGEGVALAIEEENFQPDLFSSYRPVKRDGEKAYRLSQAVREKISPAAWREMYQASLSWQPDRADAVYRFFCKGLAVGRDITNRLQEPAASRLFELSRKAANESHLFLGFTRFIEWENGILFARIAPKCHVLSLVAPHFADRMPAENWVIYDEGRKKAAVHPAGGAWYMVDMAESGWEEWVSRQGQTGDWEELWRTFVDHIAIASRANPGLQRNLLPLWYRKNMTEFLQ